MDLYSDRNAPFDGLLKAFSIIEMYGPATTAQIARQSGEPLLKVRRELKSAIPLGFVKIAGGNWTLLRNNTTQSELNIVFSELVCAQLDQKARVIAARTGVDLKLLRRWLLSSENGFFAQDKKYCWASSKQTIANETECSLSKVDDPQLAFINAPLDTDVVVMAPPGTGKTHSLIERLAYMSESLTQPSEMSSVCVLSFTNNAVNEITRRLKLLSSRTGMSDSVRYVTVRTFDSFAIKCLVAAGLPASSDFDKNIENFTSYLRGISKSNQPVPDVLRSIRWMFIDEVQDLSGERAHMVHALADVLKEQGSVYFTFLGDRHQGIYNKSFYGRDTQSFLPLQQNILMNRDVIHLVFHKSYRYQNPQFADFIDQSRKVLDERVPYQEQLQKLISTIPAVESDHLADWLGGDDRIAVLTGTNNMTVKVAAAFRQMGIEYEIAEGSSSRHYWPIWIWQIFHNWSQPSMSKAVFISKAASIADGQFLFDSLRKQGLASNDLVYVDAIAERVFAGGWQDKTEQRQQGVRVLISTTHKAKGLQYDKVAVVTDNLTFAGEDCARLLYVAMTRAKKEVRGITSCNFSAKGTPNYYFHGAEHYYFDRKENFQSSPTVIKEVVSLLTKAMTTGGVDFRIKNYCEQTWLAVKEKHQDTWFPVIKWYRNGLSSVPEDLDLTPSHWITIGWPDDAPTYKAILGAHLLMPMPVFTFGF